MNYSVIVPCYNAAATLQKTVDSIQKCGLTDFEILLIDDGSGDDTPALCDRLAAEHNNIRTIHQPNAGVSAARNRGIEEAKGDYIWFFDSDDLVDAGSMTRAAQIISEQKPDMLMFGMIYKTVGFIYPVIRNKNKMFCPTICSLIKKRNKTIRNIIRYNLVRISSI